MKGYQLVRKDEIYYGAGGRKDLCLEFLADRLERAGPARGRKARRSRRFEIIHVCRHWGRWIMWRGKEGYFQCVRPTFLFE